MLVTDEITTPTLIDLGNFPYTDTLLKYFVLKLDAENNIDETDETEESNVYLGTEEGMDLAAYTAELDVDFNGDNDTGIIDSANINNKETVTLKSRIGASTRLKDGVIKLHYAADKMKIALSDLHPSTENQIVFTETPTIVDGLITMKFATSNPEGITGDKLLVKLDFHSLYLNQIDTGALWVNFEPTGLEDDVNLFSKALGNTQDITYAVTGSPRAINIRPVFVQEVLPLSASYLSKKFSVVGATQKLSTLTSLTTIYNEAQTQDTNNYTKAYLAFFNAQGQNVGTGKPGFENGFYRVQLTTSGQPVDITALNTFGTAWLQSITSVQFRVDMKTADHNNATIEQPWIENMTLRFNADQAGEIGTISGATTLNVDPLGQVTQTYTIQRYAQESFVGRVQLSVVPVDGATPPQVQFVTPDPSGLIDIVNGNPITVTVKFQDTGAPEGEVANLSFEGVAVDDTEKDLLPLAINFSVGEGNDDPPCGSLPCPEDGVMVKITAPFEGARGSVHPAFTFRLYAGAVKAFEKTGIKLDTQNEATIALGDLAAGTYKGYLRSTRHLWKEASIQLVIVDGTEEYTLEFDELTSGDIDPNNVINVLDFGTYTFDWGKTAPNLLPDFNEDGAVNAIDVVNIIGNYFKVGSPID